jgi:hypothetical protein
MIGGMFGNKSNERLGLLVSMIIFGLIGLVQLWRALAGVSVEFGGHSIPLWFSALIGLAALAMACWMGAILRRNRPII